MRSGSNSEINSHLHFSWALVVETVSNIFPSGYNIQHFKLMFPTGDHLFVTFIPYPFTSFQSPNPVDFTFLNIVLVLSTSL